MHNTLTATLCSDRQGAPLATISGLPGDDADMSPARLRALAAALLRIADDAEARASQPAPRRGALPPARRSYPTA